MSKVLPRTCVIGAGPSGLITMKKLKDRGIPFDAFEKRDVVGGLWSYDETGGSSACYKSLHINTSRETMEFACYPMPETLPTYCHHSDIASYFNDFADHFDLRPSIKFATEVEKATRLEDGHWQVKTSDGQTRLYESLVVANGHHWDPRWPTPAFKGEFDGITMHSHQYKDPTVPHNLRGKNVVVVGMGNSAMDIACELGARGQAAKVFLSVRRGTHILPKYFGARTPDSYVRLPGKKPWFFERLLPDGTVFKVFYPLVHLRTKLAVGNPEDFGLPKPKHKFGATHPTISNEIHTRLGSGDVLPKPNIKELKGDSVEFEDGSVEKVDAIIYATGYNISFPFFDEKVVDTSDNDVALFKRVMNPDYNNLFFVGLIQPLCSVMPVAEVQARWISRYLAGEYCLPSVADMKKDIHRQHEGMKRKYVSSKRHTIQIECMDYTRDLYVEQEQGMARADKRGNEPPVLVSRSQGASALGQNVALDDKEGDDGRGWQETADEAPEQSGDIIVSETDIPPARL